MAPSLDLERLNYIFQSRPDIVEAIKINAGMFAAPFLDETAVPTRSPI